MSNPEVIELNVDDPATIQLNSNDMGAKKSVNFGPGIELLMNEKTKSGGGSEPGADIELGDLNKLEAELNDLSDSTANAGISKKDATNMMENIGLSSKSSTPPGVIDSKPISLSGSIDLNNTSGISTTTPADTPQIPSNVGKSSSEGSKKGKTWDGFGSFNDIPMNPDMKVPDKPKISREDMLREKFEILRKLEDLERKGVQLSKKYSMESPLAEMQGEYETLVAERERKNSVQFQGKMLLAAITGLEFLNNKIDPFDLKLDGWSEQVNENLNDYDEIFAELHEKYRSKSKLAPELKLMFQLGGSAIMLHMTNSMFKSSLPNMDDIMRQNPDLMRQFSSAAANSMGDTNPGFSGFMNNMMNSQDTNDDGLDSVGMGGPPPPPMKTRDRSRDRNIPQNVRDNIKMSQSNASDGINIMESFGNVNANEPEKTVRRPRPEMKGPSDISDLLSGLKTKTINVSNEKNDDAGSTVSITELQERDGALNSSSAPKKSKRRPISERNTISLDI